MQTPPSPLLAAHEQGIATVALCPAGQAPDAGQQLAIEVPAEGRSRVVELHTLVLHTLCHLIEFNLFGSYQQA